MELIFPQGGNISRLYPICYSTRVYIGGIYYIVILQGVCSLRSHIPWQVAAYWKINGRSVDKCIFKFPATGHACQVQYMLSAGK